MGNCQLCIFQENKDKKYDEILIHLTLKCYTLKILLDVNDIKFHFLPCEFIVLDSRETYSQNHNITDAIFGEVRVILAHFGSL